MGLPCESTADSRERADNCDKADWLIDSIKHFVELLHREIDDRALGDCAGAWLGW